jgi:UDP-N-acetylmuramoyl-L-alanyl-D-glutamate--2,6-diaminopimelate ligase
VNIRLQDTATAFSLQTSQEKVDVNISMVGKFNIYNCLAAAAACLIEGVPLSSIKASLEAVAGVSGRFERVDIGQDYTVIVDYAHTPDSLKNVLETAQEFTGGRIYCIVGCGGDRDRGKRPLMAQIAVQYTDFAIFTADNPRSEDPEQIIADMLAGLPAVSPKGTAWRAITDRREAIEYAVSRAQKGDCILIAGKGHETYQIIKGQVFPFDDREVAKAAIRKRI